VFFLSTKVGTGIGSDDSVVNAASAFKRAARTSTPSVVICAINATADFSSALGSITGLGAANCSLISPPEFLHALSDDLLQRFFGPMTKEFCSDLRADLIRQPLLEAGRDLRDGGLANFQDYLSEGGPSTP
jgi:hypothetical protein